jgi:tape measure domain-containing protein
VADISIGNITATIRADSTEFQRGIATALASLQQFQQALAQQSGTIQQSMQGSLRQMASGLQGIQQSQTATAQSTQQLTQQLAAMGQTLQATGQQARTFGTAWQAALQVAGGIGLATTIQGIARAVIQFSTESVQLAARMQDLHRSFTAIEGSGGAANRTLTFLFDTAQRVGVSFTSLAESFRRLEAGAKGTTLSGDDLKRAMEGIATGARVMGLSTQENQRAMTAWEQILTKGRLSSEELVQQLGEAVPGALNIVSRSLGVTTAQLRAMAESGLIPGTLAFVAFSEEMRKIGQTGGGIETLSTTFAKLANETLAWKAALGGVLTEVIQPILRDVITLSEELRKLMGIRGPGEQPSPGATPGGGIVGRLFPGPLSPTTLGMPAPGTFGPTEQPGAAFVPPGGLPMAASRFTPLIQQEAQRAGIDPGLLSQLIRTESAFNPQAVSRAGAVGLGQIMPGTAEMLQPGITPAQLRDPETNIRLAATYLSRLLKSLKDFDDKEMLALASYNAGPKRVADLLEAAGTGGRPMSFAGIQGALPRETQQYVQNVLSLGGPGGAGGGTGGAGDVEGQTAKVAAFQKQIEDTLTQTKLLQEQIEAMATSGGNFGTVMDQRVAQAATNVVTKLADINQGFATLPAIANQLPPALREAVVEATKQANIWKETLLTDTQRRDLLKQQVDQAEQLTIRRQTELVALRQGQQEAERFARLATAARQAEDLRERPRMAGMTTQQQIAEYENRLQALQNRANEFGNQLEAQRAQAMRPGLEAELQRIEALMGRPGQSLAAQAAANVEVQFAQARKTLETILQELPRTPGLQDLQEKFQNLFQGIGEAAAQQSQIAFDRVNDQMRLRVEAMGDQIEQVGERIAGAGLDPLSAALSAIRREFAGMVNQLEALQRALEELAKGATSEQQAAIAAQQERIQAALAQVPAARERREGEARIEAQVPRLQREAEASARQFETIQGMRNEIEDMRVQRLNQQPGPFGFGRVQTRQEREAMERLTPDNRVIAEDLQAQRREQERLNYAAGLFAEMATDIGSAWSTALFSIADGTKTVSQAFEDMAKSIMRSIAQMAAQEATRAFISLGFRLLFGAAGGAAGGGMGFGMGGGFGGESPMAVGAGINPIMFQHGGVVNRPTLAMIGEGRHNPEYVLNSRQMNQAMSDAVRQGTQAGGQATQGAVQVSNIFVRSQAEAEDLRRQEEAAGRIAIVSVMREISRGESSQIVRTMRTLQR